MIRSEPVKRLSPEQVEELRRARASVARLLEAAVKGGPVYETDPPRVADVNRLGKRLATALDGMLRTHGPKE